MKCSYKTKGTCATQISFELDNDIVRNVRFTGGCSGNLKAIPILIEGMTVDAIESKLKGLSCNGRATSCADQLAHAVRDAYTKSNQV